MTFAIKVNGNTHNVDVDGDTALLWVLRDMLGMTGTKFGCGMALCGATKSVVENAQVSKILEASKLRLTEQSAALRGVADKMAVFQIP